MLDRWVNDDDDDDDDDDNRDVVTVNCRGMV